jgi:hypothetical protein
MPNTLYYLREICHPTVKILGGKSDFKAAYRRVNLHGDTAAKCSIMYRELGLPCLRLTFGGYPPYTDIWWRLKIALHCREQ